MIPEQIQAGRLYLSVTGWTRHVLRRDSRKVWYRRHPPGKPDDWSDEIEMDASKFAALSFCEVEEVET